MIIQYSTSRPHSPFERWTWGLVWIGAVGEHIALALAGFEVEQVVRDGEFFGGGGGREDGRGVWLGEEV